MIVAVGNDSQYQRLCVAVGREDLAQEPAYASNVKRVEHREELGRELQQALRLKKTDDWLEIFRKEGVPSGPINDIKQMFADPQVQHRAVAIDVEGMPLVANPIKYSRSNMTYDKPPPTLGEDTQVVLSEYLGLCDDEISKLREQGIVG